MSPLVRYEVRDRVAVVTVDNPPVNALGTGVPEAIGDVTRRVVQDEEIIARIMTALANEGARVLEEGYATRASDIDVVYVHGFGFPRRRGGPMFYADTVGLATVLERVNRYRGQFGDYWRPSPLLEKLAIDNRGLYGDAA